MKKEIFDTISARFIQYITRFKKPKTTEEFLNQLLSDKEKILLTKRFAIILLLDRGYTFHTIINSLKVSNSTIATLQKKRKRGDFKSFTNFVLENKGNRSITSNTNEDTFLKTLEKIVQAGMPPISGRGRWRSFPRAKTKITIKTGLWIIKRKKK